MNTQEIDLTIPDQEIEIIEDSELLGIYEGGDSDEISLRLRIVHRGEPGLKSRVHIKAILRDNAKLDLEGLLRIEKGAEKSDTYLKVDILLLGEHAKARIVPSLEILEDDVRGGHGATIGRLDDNQVHYLMSRGFSSKETEKILIESFLKEIRQKLDDK